MIGLSLNELKLVAESRGIKDYKNKSEYELIKTLSELRPKISLSKKRMKKIGEKFNELKDRFSKPEIKEIRRNLHKISKQYNLSTPKIKEIKENLIKLEKNIFK